MPFSLAIFILSIVFMTLVMPFIVIMHYTTKWKATKGLSDDEHRMQEHMEVFRCFTQDAVGVRGYFLVRPGAPRTEQHGERNSGQDFHKRIWLRERTDRASP